MSARCEPREVAEYEDRLTHKQRASFVIGADETVELAQVPISSLSVPIHSFPTDGTHGFVTWFWTSSRHGESYDPRAAGLASLVPRWRSRNRGRSGRLFLVAVVFRWFHTGGDGIGRWRGGRGQCRGVGSGVLQDLGC